MATSALKAAAIRRKASKGMSAATKAKYYSVAGKVTAGVAASKKKNSGAAKAYAREAKRQALAGAGAIEAHRTAQKAYNFYVQKHPKIRANPNKSVGPGNGGGAGGAG